MLIIGYKYIEIIDDKKKMKETNEFDGILDLNGNLLSSDECGKIITDVQNLPATLKADEIINAMKNHALIVVRGDTGSGKSTQIPKFVREYQLENGIAVPNMRIIQPRVASAVGLASRVSNEMLAETQDDFWSLGNGVGYSTGRGVSRNENTQIDYTTSGYELMRQIGQDSVPKTLILDEFHTDDIGNTMLAYIVREALLKTRDNFNVVITSATINTLKTLSYFEKLSKDIPVITIEGRTFPIEKINSEPREFISDVKTEYDAGNSVLVFESGKNEIKKTIEELKEALGTTRIYAFHSHLSIEEQREIINLDVNRSDPVIIVATNAAEESLTVTYLDTVIDKGEYKKSSIDSLGYNRLDTLDISNASMNQRGGRVGRVRDGKSIWSNSRSPDTLEPFPEAPIISSTLEREVLIFLKNGVDVASEITAHKNRGESMFIDSPSDELVQISYQRLYRLGAIDEQGITKVGEKILQYPLSVFSSRMLIESIDRNVSKDVLEMVAIIENDGFLMAKGLWKELYSTAKKSNIKSDMFFQLKILREFMDTDAAESFCSFLAGQGGFGYGWIDGYKNSEDSMVFEHLDAQLLENFGINKRSLERISETISNLKERLEKQGVVETDNGDIDDKIISLLSGSLHNIFSFDHQKKVFENTTVRSSHEFVQSDASILSPETTSKEISYIGTPIIIGGKEKDDDFSLIHGLTQVHQEHLDLFKELLFKDMPALDFRKKMELVVARKAFEAQAKNAEKHKILDIPTTRKSIARDFVVQATESSPDYSDIIIYLAHINKEKRDALKTQVPQLFELKNRYAFEKKRHNWIESHLENIKHLLDGDNISMSRIGLESSTNMSILMTDPVISTNNLFGRATKLKESYRKLVRMMHVCGYTQKGEINELDPNKLGKHTLSLQKIFSRNKGIKERADNYLKNFCNNLEKRIQDITSQKSTLEQQSATGKSGNRSTMKALSVKQRDLKRLSSELNSYIPLVNELRDDIEEINFEEIVFKLYENNNNIGELKYLYSLLSKVIFNGDVIDSRSKAEEKLKTRLQKYTGDNFDRIYLEKVLNSIKILTSDTKKSPRNEAYLILEKFHTELSSFHTKKSQMGEIEGEIQNLSGLAIGEVFGFVQGLLLEFFDEDYVTQNEVKIYTFIKKISQLSVKGFDQALAEFFSQFTLTKSTDSKQIFTDIENYEYMTDRIHDYFLSRIQKGLHTDETDPEEIYRLTNELEDLLEESKLIKNRISSQIG